ncbi:MFS transporter [Citricoccus zhacaiensis]
MSTSEHFENKTTPPQGGTDTSTAAADSKPSTAHDVTSRDVKIASWICFFAWTFAVYDFVLFGNLLPQLAASLGWSEAHSTEVNTWVTAGTALVAFAIGPLTDKIGRRKGILVAVAGAALASLLTATVGWVYGIAAGLGLVFLVVVRSIAGLGYAEQAINAAYLNEMFAHRYSDPAKARRRGLIYSLVQSGWPVGSVLAASSVYLLFPIGGWELCFAVAALPAVFILWAGRWLKESPQFRRRQEVDELRRAGHADEARERAVAYGISSEKQSSPITAVFRGKSLRPTLVIGSAFLLNWVGVLAFSILGTSLLTAESGKNISFDNALTILIVSNATAFLGYLFHGWLGDRIGRRNTIGLAWIVCSMCFFAMLQAPDGNYPLIVALYSAGLFFLIGPFSALLFFTGESFPVHTRATGSSLINASGQVGAIIGGVLITATLSAGQSWETATLWWGCLPILAAGLLVFAAPNVDPRTVRTD